MDIKNLLRLLKENDVRFVVIGGVACVAHGFDRLTKDIDIFVEPTMENMQRTFNALTTLGYDLTDVTIEEALQKNNFEALHNECWNGLKNMWGRDLIRDFAISKHLGLELRTPFLDRDLIKIAMSIHPMFKLDKDNKKIILRESAEFIGLKHEFAWRKKQAAQYGSNFVNGIEKLARKNGFKYKKDYLQSLLRK